MCHLAACCADVLARLLISPAYIWALWAAPRGGVRCFQELQTKERRARAQLQVPAPPPHSGSPSLPEGLTEG